MSKQQFYLDIASRIADMEGEDRGHMTKEHGLLPSSADIDNLTDAIREAVFPMIYSCHACQPDSQTAYLQNIIANIDAMLRQLIRMGLYAATPLDEAQVEQRTEHIAEEFLKQLPAIRRLLMSDVEAIAQNDPAVSSQLEIISCYPAIAVMLHHRVAHALHLLGLPLIPRIISERAHTLTGIDIHPAARIGASFGIDHGTGIVIGATSIIGSHVMLYQGVTLGAKNFQHDANGLLLDHPRHPIIEDHVTIYSNTSVLGRIRIGHDSVIGGNLWITHDVAPHSVVRQQKPVKQMGFSDGAGI